VYGLRILRIRSAGLVIKVSRVIMVHRVVRCIRVIDIIRN
jgi:hypothetical protein